jgi:hypothetical protein
MMMGGEGAGHCTSGYRQQHRRLHLNEPTPIKKAAYGGDQAAAYDEDMSSFLIGDEV